MTQNPLLMLKCVIQTMLLIFTSNSLKWFTWAAQNVLLNFTEKVFFYFVSEKLEADDKIEDGATVFAVIKTHNSLKNVVDEVAYKEVKRQV